MIDTVANVMTVKVGGELVLRPIDCWNSVAGRYEPVLRLAEMCIWTIDSDVPIIIPY